MFKVMSCDVRFFITLLKILLYFKQVNKIFTTSTVENHVFKLLVLTLFQNINDCNQLMTCKQTVRFF